MEVAKKDESKFKTRNANSFLKLEKSLGELASQLTAIDGLTFNRIAKSERLKLKKNLPRSHKKAQDLVKTQRQDK